MAGRLYQIFRGAVVIVSHDRYFLDKLSNKILSLDDVEAKIYATNYSGYLEQKQRDFEVQLAAFKDQQQAIKRLEEQIKYFSEMGMAKIVQLYAIVHTLFQLNLSE